MPERLPRTLIIDACILFSFFKSDSDRRRIIEELSNLGCRLISTEFVFEELAKNEGRIKRSAKINELKFVFLFSLLEKRIELFPKEVYTGFLRKANKISPHCEQTKDDPYFALALALNSPIWSDESDFKQQSKVKIFSTRELLELMGLV